MEDSLVVNVSGARTGEHMGGGDATPHFGLEHFGVNVDDLDAEIKRLEEMGATLVEDRRGTSTTGTIVAFIEAPDNVRIEIMQAGR